MRRHPRRSRPAPVCPWCSAPLSGRPETLPVVRRQPDRSTRPSPSLPGVTAIDAAAIVRASPAPAPRNRLLSWISGDYPERALTRRPRPRRSRRPTSRSDGRSCGSSSRPRSRTCRPRPTRCCRGGRRGAAADDRHPPRTAGRLAPEGLEAAVEPRPPTARPRRRRAAAGRDRTLPPTGRDRSRATGRPAPPADDAYPARRPCPTASRPRPVVPARARGPRRRPRPSAPAWAARPRHPTAGGWPSSGSPTTTASSASATSPRPPVRRPTRRSPVSGPAIAGALSGLILEDAGRLQLRLGAVAPPDDPTRPWRSPLAVRAAFRFEPARAATMRPNELAETVLAAFAEPSRASTGPDGPGRRARLADDARPVRRLHGGASPPRGRRARGTDRRSGAPPTTTTVARTTSRPDDERRRCPARARRPRRRRRPARRQPATVAPAAGTARRVRGGSSVRRGRDRASFLVSPTFGIDIWTDALWYPERRLRPACSGRGSAPQAGLFVGALVVALVVLLGNLWLAGRLSAAGRGRRPARHDPSLVRPGQRGRAGADPDAPGRSVPVAADRAPTRRSSLAERRCRT